MFLSLGNTSLVSLKSLLMASMALAWCSSLLPVHHQIIDTEWRNLRFCVQCRPPSESALLGWRLRRKKTLLLKLTRNALKAPLYINRAVGSKRTLDLGLP